MSRSDRAKPSLPQHDTAAGQRQRTRALARAKETYQWTTDVDTLTGVPLAAKVPMANYPSIPWLLTAVKGALPIVRNVIAGGPMSWDGDDPNQRLDEIGFSLEDVEQAHIAAAEPTAAFGIGEMFDAAVEAAASLVSSHNEKLWNHLNELKEMADKQRASSSKGVTLDEYAELFHTLTVPEVAKVFVEDSTFARMRVAGPNPMLLAKVDADSLGIPLTDAQVEGLLAPGETFSAALAAGRVFQVDYAGLEGIVSGSHDGNPQYMWRPIAVFAVPKGGRDLVPVAIKLDQADDADVVIAPKAGEYTNYTWEMAKFSVQVADGNYHELFVHLARTHLVEEAFTLATYRCLAPSHPVSILLAPHFQGTLFINMNAAGSLIAEGGAIDRIFAGTIDTIQSTTVKNRLAFDFLGSLLPLDLQRRGVDDVETLPDFPYRDDGLLVWNALATWTAAYVDTYYASDTDIVGDTELAAWSAELIATGKMGGFAAPTTRSQLADILTMVIFTASAQHAAVNFPQLSLMSYAPNVTGAAWSTVDQGGQETQWLDMMPPLDIANEQLKTLWFLGSIYFSKLGDYKEADFPYSAWFLDDAITRSGGPLQTLQATLAEAEQVINARNAERPLPYDYLVPSKIPQSINI